MEFCQEKGLRLEKTWDHGDYEIMIRPLRREGRLGDLSLIKSPTVRATSTTTEYV